MTDRAILNAPSDVLLAALEGAVGARAEDPAPYLAEPRGLWRGRAAAVLRPRATAQVAEIVARCAEARVGVIPYGGGTGLVGGQVSEADPPCVVVSLERMDGVGEADLREDAITVGAGAILAAVRSKAAEAGRLFPLSLASEGSARIGGLLACNAGGIATLRYGNARDLTLGIEAVLPDGSVLRGPRALRKDNAGYDLRHLLIGAEGTLGVITAAALKLHPRPRETATAFAATPDPVSAGALLSRTREALGEAVSAFELMSATGMAFLAEHLPEVPKPPVAGRWFVLVEAAGAPGTGELLTETLAAAMAAGLVEDAAIAQSEAQRADMWRIREDTPEANRRVGAVASHDVSLPLGRIADFVEAGAAAVARINSTFRINCFGHLGDGNLHYNVFPGPGAPKGSGRERAAELRRAVHDLVHERGGSVAAEHGIGRLKTEDLARYGDPAKLAAMRVIRRALDPHGIMNPGAVLPACPHPRR